MASEDDKIFGHDKFVYMDCPHCKSHVYAELIELRVFTKIYKCPECPREIHGQTLLGKAFPFLVAGGSSLGS